MLYGVIVSVHADAGVFPAGAALSVTRVLLLEQKQAEAAVEDVRDENENVAASYTFDIKVIDPMTGAEYQPADGQVVSVSFSLAEVADENLTTSVYHIAEDAQGMTAEPLEVTTEDEVTATVETDGFSIYTVEFTYGSMQYVLDVDGSGTVTIRGGHGANANNGIDGANADIAVMGNVTVEGNDFDATKQNDDYLYPQVTIIGGTGGDGRSSWKNGSGANAIYGTLRVNGGFVFVKGGQRGGGDRTSSGSMGRSITGNLYVTGGKVKINNSVFRNREKDNASEQETVVQIKPAADKHAQVEMWCAEIGSNIIQGATEVYERGRLIINSDFYYGYTPPAYFLGNLTVNGGDVFCYSSEEWPEDRYVGVRGDLEVNGGRVMIQSFVREVSPYGCFGGVTGNTTLRLTEVGDYVDITSYCGAVNIDPDFPLVYQDTNKNVQEEYSGTLPESAVIAIGGKKLEPPETKYDVVLNGNVKGGRVSASRSLTASLPDDTYSDIKWTSSNKKVATVKNGVVKFKKKGKVTITATARRGGKKAKVKFVVGK